MNNGKQIHDTRNGPIDEFADDAFITTSPITANCCAVFSRYRHFGREYVRWRIWHHRRAKSVSYPDKRRFCVVSVENAEAFGQAILQAARGEPDPSGPPAYIQAFDKARAAW